MGFFTSKRKEQGWMAVSLHPERVDLAHVCRRAGAKPEIRTLESFKCDKAPGMALDVLRRQRRLAGYRCVTALGSGDYQILQVDAPGVPREELKEAVRWRIKDLIDYAPDAATLDAVEVPSASGSARARSVYVVCARNDVVRTRMQLFEQAKVPLEVIDVPEMALRNVAALWSEPGRAVAVALMAFDDQGGTLVITAGGELCASRRIEVTGVQLADDDKARQHACFERVGLELQRSFDHYDRQPGAFPIAALRVAGPAAPELVAYLGNELPVAVEPVDLASVLDFPSVPELRDAGRQAQCLVAIGLALRDEEAAP
jgi:MSHA biogenesis protein MshI